MSLFDFFEEEETVVKPEPSADVGPVAVQARPLTVSELTFQVKGLLEEVFSEIWVVGEISNFSKPRSGHVYLTLKDDSAQLPCAVWKTVMSKVRFDLKDGLEILCRGRLEVYPPHGKYQMIVTNLEPKGIGALELAFRQLHAKLDAEGLFDPKKKRPIPASVKTVAVITSPTGAAIHDFLQVLGRRTQQVNVRIIPVKVQGDGAAKEIASAIELVNRLVRADRSFADCIVVTRGGGSTEDLWAFNEEPLVRAVAASELPTISAVGHEVDVSLCDLAADLRALTPSEAAERIAPEDSRLRERLLHSRRLLEDSLLKRIRLADEKLRSYAKHPAFERPMRLIEDRRKTVDLLEQNLDRNMDRAVENSHAKIAKISATLDALSPLAVLGRGYSLTQTTDGTVVRSENQVQPGDKLYTRLGDGTIRSIVEFVIRKS
ncbi:MAG: exodeoxyribonuclease VII large subunit [Planctomycetaceae bacterium]|nr:exodeoxyribonuclease VII large subunit [Planctomycetaceae bacterium]